MGLKNIMMKTANTILKLFIVSLVLMACNTEDPAELDASLHQPEVETPAESAGTFTAKIDGTEYIIDVATAVLDLNVQPGVVPTILITGKKGTETITLRMPSTIGTNSGINPNILGGAASTYAAFYNTDVSTVSEATVLSDLHMTIIEGSIETDWIAESPSAVINGGATTIKGVRIHREDINDDGDLESFTQSVEMVIQANISGSYVFGPTNIASYGVGGAGGDIFKADATVDNGAVTLEFDDVNKLVSGSFNFFGTENYTQIGTAPTGDDTDGDGMFDDVETSLGYDPNSACSPIMPEGYVGYDATNAIWMTTDCVNDPAVLTYNDIVTAGNDPYAGNTDTDGDGVSDAQEVIDGTDENDPCDPAQNQFYTNYSGTNATWMAADCDGDTIINGDELKGPDGDIATTADNTNPYFKDFLTKEFSAGSFTKIPYAQPAVKRGLNISTHDTATKKIVGTFSFISASLGEEDVRWYVVTDGAFDVIYTVIPVTE
ncbi:MAG: hypothetical protein COA88_07540 [Kordia sp.]|nr:MAG: hypothetical protein COA88_07540 [Kordia sp.]